MTNKGDLISRNYVESIVKAEFVDLQDGTDEWRTYVNETCENILNKVHNAPTVDIKDIYQEGRCDGHLEGYTKAINEERPQGKWERRTMNDYRCSNCHYKVDSVERLVYKFCPKCGTAMKKENENESES